MKMVKRTGLALRGKLNNRRIDAIRLSDGSTEFYFKRLCDGGKEIAHDSIRLSDEAISTMLNMVVEFQLKEERS